MSTSPRVRDLRRSLSKLGWTPSAIDRVGLLRSDLEQALYDAEKKKGEEWWSSEHPSSSSSLASSSGGLWDAVVVAFYFALAAASLCYALPSASALLSRRARHFEVAAGSAVAAAAVAGLCVLDAMKAWCRATVLAGLVCPGRYAYLLVRYGMPFPPLTVSPSMMTGQGGGGGGMNVFPLVFNFLAGKVEGWLEGVVVYGVSRSGGRKKKKKKTKKLYEDDM